MNKPASWKIMKLEQFAAFHWEINTFVRIAKHVCKSYMSFEEAYRDAVFQRVFEIANSKLNEHSPIGSEMVGLAESAGDADDAAIHWFYKWAGGNNSGSPPRNCSDKTLVDEHTLDPRLRLCQPPTSVSSNGDSLCASTTNKMNLPNSQEKTIDESSPTRRYAITEMPCFPTPSLADGVTGEKRSAKSVCRDKVGNHILEDVSQEVEVEPDSQPDKDSNQARALSCFETLAPSVLTSQKVVKVGAKEQYTPEEPRCSICGASRWGVHQHTRECPERLFFDRR
ncbi:hypothetical protein LTS18_015052 [Coniosporium uncinatum]|uniref:Uncharacterized protein n=1 Tax=Coniosporium uncinatum TaxID=93489 RepID=A0ACC3DV66_9PEZI|nr:hypothetical protein LTS18_015052 [Coniosporium uncinatum]